jgi:fatty-acyl-CoA synthase
MLVRAVTAARETPEALPSTLAGLVDLRADTPGDAVVFAGERADYRQFADATVEMARRLHGAGVRKGDRVGLLMNASLDAFALQLGAMRLGAIPVPINARFKALELHYVIRHSGMRILVTEPTYSGLLEEADATETCRVVTGTQDPVFAAGAEGADAATVAAALAQVGGDDDGLMLYTSGTTAHPKGCVHRHSAIVAEGERIAERLHLTSEDRFWTPLPFFHVGSIAILAGALAAGCASLQMAHFEPGLALDQLEHERCTVAFPAFETIWLGVLNHPRFPAADLSRIRLVINVGVPPSLVAMQERLPHAPQISCFGSTETCAFACLGEAHHSLEARVTTSGLPLRDIEIRTISPETGEDVGPGEVGELIMRGPTRFMRYHDDPEQTALTIDEEGWYHSGDLGRLDAEGRVSFVGRLKDMLKVGGENVAAAEVEAFLVTHPACEIVQVVGAPDTRYTEVAAAFVQLRAGTTATEQELIDYCRGQIATFKVPRYVRFVDEWPMSGTKIQKFKLREQITSELEAAGITEAPRITSGR